jgi:hypothetical protein
VAAPTSSMLFVRDGCSSSCGTNISPSPSRCAWIRTTCCRLGCIRGRSSRNKRLVRDGAAFSPTICRLIAARSSHLLFLEPRSSLRGTIVVCRAGSRAGQIPIPLDKSPWRSRYLTAVSEVWYCGRRRLQRCR